MSNKDEPFTGSAAAWALVAFLILLVGAVLYQGMRILGFDPADVFEFWRDLL
jgi:hypothetical protein